MNALRSASNYKYVNEYSNICIYVCVCVCVCVLYEPVVSLPLLQQ